MTAQPLILEGAVVRLTPLAFGDVDALVAAAGEDRSTFAFTLVPADAHEMRDYVDALLEQAAEGSTVPFVTRWRADDRVLGCTRFLSIQRWFGREHPDALEIGGTWLAASAQRTAANTEAKYLLLRHAFEVWDVQRVDLRTDARNERSRAAIERVGARFEGVLRSWQPSLVAGEDGQPRDTAIFSIVTGEWPGVRDRLEALLRQ